MRWLVGTLMVVEVMTEIRSGTRETQDINTVLDWRVVEVPGQRESVTSAEENLRIAERDIPAPPLTPKELEAGVAGGKARLEGDDPIELVSGPFVHNFSLLHFTTSVAMQYEQVKEFRWISQNIIENYPKIFFRITYFTHCAMHILMFGGRRLNY